MTNEVEPAWLDEGYYSIPEASNELHIGDERLRTWCRSGLIRSYKGASRKHIVCAADIDAIVEHVGKVKSTLTIDMVRRLGKLGKIGIPKESSRQGTKPFPVGALPFDTAMGLLQEAMREALAEYGMLKGTSEIIVSNAARAIERLYDTHISSSGGDA